MDRGRKRFQIMQQYLDKGITVEESVLVVLTYLYDKVEHNKMTTDKKTEINRKVKGEIDILKKHFE